MELFTVWNVAGVPGGFQFLVENKGGGSAYYDTLLPMLVKLDIEHWHIDFVARTVGRYHGTAQDVLEQQWGEKNAPILNESLFTPGARYGE